MACYQGNTPQALIPRSAYEFDRQVTAIAIGEGSGPKPLRVFLVQRFEQLLGHIDRFPQHREMDWRFDIGDLLANTRYLEAIGEAVLNRS